MLKSVGPLVWNYCFNWHELGRCPLDTTLLRTWPTENHDRSREFRIKGRSTVQNQVRPLRYYYYYLKWPSQGLGLRYSICCPIPLDTNTGLSRRLETMEGMNIEFNKIHLLNNYRLRICTTTCFVSSPHLNHRCLMLGPCSYFNFSNFTGITFKHVIPTS